MKRGRYDREFKQEIWRLAETSDESLSELEQELGLSHGLIRKRRQRYKAEPVNNELQPRNESELEAENRLMDTRRLANDTLNPSPHPRTTLGKPRMM